MNNYEEQYLDLLKNVYRVGIRSSNRTGINTRKIWGTQIHINLQDGFPLLTTKKMHWKSVVHELLWMIKGDTNIQYLLKNGVTFWTEWPYQKYCSTPINKLLENERGGFPPHWEHKTQKEFEQEIINNDEFAKKWGSIGEFGYGGMWRKFPYSIKEANGMEGLGGNYYDLVQKSVDQLSNTINELKTNPDSRRIIITAWHPYHSNRIEDALLPACFPLGTFVETKDGYNDISDIKTTNTVDSGNGEYHSVIETFKTKYNGNILKIKYRYGLPIECTENHPILIKDKGFVEARDIKVNDFIGIYRNKENIIPSFEWQDQYKINHSYSLTKNDMWCLGYFLGDGFINFNLDKNQEKINSFGLCINGDDTNLILKFEETFNCKFYKKKGSGNSFTLMATSKKWANVLRCFGHTCYNKKIPDFILNSPNDFIKEFINGYIYADGHEFKDNFASTTVSPNIALGIQKLCVKIGIPCGITLSKRKGKKHIIENREVNTSDLFYIRIPKKPVASLYQIDENYMWLKVRNIKSNKFDGYVYNLSVDISHTYTANNIVTHNCHNYIQFGTEELTQDERFDLYRKSGGNYGWVSVPEMNEKVLNDANIPKYRLNCYFNMRSSDTFLGLPFNCAFYALFTHLIANQLNMIPNRLVYTAADVHLYENHLEQVKLQLARQPRELPKLNIKTPGKSIFDIKFEDIDIVEYNPYPAIKADVAI